VAERWVRFRTLGDGVIEMPDVDAWHLMFADVDLKAAQPVDDDVDQVEYHAERLGLRVHRTRRKRTAPVPPKIIVYEDDDPRCRHCGIQRKQQGLAQHESHCPHDPARANGGVIH
jgi:hypothetical protein